MAARNPGARDGRVKRLAAYKPDPELLKLRKGVLVEILLDLRLRISRERSDASGVPMCRMSEVTRPENTEGAAKCQVGNKAKVVASIEATVKEIAKETGWIEVSEVAKRMGKHRRTAGSIWRRPEYMAPILRANGQDVPELIDDPERARIEHLLKEEVIEEIKRSKRELRVAKGEFEEAMDDDDTVELDELIALAAKERAAVGRTASRA